MIANDTYIDVLVVIHDGPASHMSMMKDIRGNVNPKRYPFF